MRSADLARAERAGRGCAPCAAPIRARRRRAVRRRPRGGARPEDRGVAVRRARHRRPSSSRGSRRCSAWSSIGSTSSRCRAGATSSARSPATLRDCTGEEKCLAAIGKKLGVDVVVTGTVGSLGDNYVLDIKAVDVATAQAAAADPERSAARPARRADRGRARRGVQAARARSAPRRDPDPDRSRRRRGRARRQAGRQDAAAATTA